MPTGKIKWFNRQIGAGFIRGNEGENIFFRSDAVYGTDPQALRKGQDVRFDIAKNARRLSLTAVRIMAAPAECVAEEVRL